MAGRDREHGVTKSFEASESHTCIKTSSEQQIRGIRFIFGRISHLGCAVEEPAW